MEDEFTMQQKMKVIGKLAAENCDTEKKLAKLDMASILAIKGITIPDMNIILKLQENTKNAKLYSYLCGGIDRNGTNEE